MRRGGGAGPQGERTERMRKTCPQRARRTPPASVFLERGSRRPPRRPDGSCRRPLPHGSAPSPARPPAPHRGARRAAQAPPPALQTEGSCPGTARTHSRPTNDPLRQPSNSSTADAAPVVGVPIDPPLRRTDGPLWRSDAGDNAARPVPSARTEVGKRPTMSTPTSPQVPPSAGTQRSRSRRTPCRQPTAKSTFVIQRRCHGVSTAPRS
jgi:hypothetical protein